MTLAADVAKAIHAAYKLLEEGLEAPAINIPTQGSTALGKVTWDPLSWDLDITFRHKAHYGNYTFPGVHINTVTGLARAGSKGKYYHRRLKRHSTRG